MIFADLWHIESKHWCWPRREEHSVQYIELRYCCIVSAKRILALNSLMLELLTCCLSLYHKLNQLIASGVIPNIFRTSLPCLMKHYMYMTQARWACRRWRKRPNRRCRIIWKFLHVFFSGWINDVPPKWKGSWQETPRNCRPLFSFEL